MDAYVLLGVGYDASPLDIRKAYKLKARERHPDRLPAGSPEHREANALMAAVNAAYQLVRDAPLRHHRVSTCARPDEPWTDDELQSAIRKARRDQAVSRAFGVALSGLALAIFLILSPMVSSANPALGLAFGAVAVFLMVLTPTGLFTWRALYLFRSASHVFHDLSHLLR